MLTRKNACNHDGFKVLASAALLALAAGCGAALEGALDPMLGVEDPVVGEWRSRDKVGGERNSLELFEDESELLGGMTVYAYMDVDGYTLLAEFEFEVEAKQLREEDYRFDIACQKLCFPQLDIECFTGDLSKFDDELACELDGKNDEMECDGDDGWSSYAFKWERR